MPLPRLHLFELEDQPWCPAIVRDLATDYLHFIESKFALHQPAVSVLGEALRKTGARHIVDLCSGGGGPIPALQQALLAEGLDVRFTLTDRFPNLAAFQRIAAQRPDRISFVSDPVDAKAVPEQLVGFRTLFNSFHHFDPNDAAAILRDAVTRGQPIGIFEIPDRSWRMLWPMMVLTPFVVLAATPAIRPFRWRRLLWTYLLPLVPLVCWWDGIISQLRAYTVQELLALADGAGAPKYYWQAGRVALATVPGHLTFLIGHK